MYRLCLHGSYGLHRPQRPVPKKAVKLNHSLPHPVTISCIYIALQKVTLHSMYLYYSYNCEHAVAFEHNRANTTINGSAGLGHQKYLMHIDEMEEAFMSIHVWPSPFYVEPWWYHDVGMLSALLAFWDVTPSNSHYKAPIMQSFDVGFAVCLTK